jgi:hypothetical protein
MKVQLRKSRAVAPTELMAPPSKAELPVKILSVMVAEVFKRKPMAPPLPKLGNADRGV